MSSTAASIKVIKRFTFKGVTKDWSNRYHFNGADPSDAAHWLTFSDAVVNAEKLIYKSSMTIIGTVGYVAGSDIPVYSKTYSTAGTASVATFQYSAAEVAALVRYSTGARSTKNHPIYLYNYYHGALSETTLDADTLNLGQKTLINTYAAAWITGFSDGVTTHHRCGPQGDLATGYLTNPYLTHRDFPRG